MLRHKPSGCDLFFSNYAKIVNIFLNNVKFGPNSKNYTKNVARNLSWHDLQTIFDNLFSLGYPLCFLYCSKSSQMVFIQFGFIYLLIG